ncbi:MAG: hypothetical protein LUC21_08415 [Oscillospiraceae bacterium]|nr:hypothetical protein [Oscillospiraceae bacterium]MCC8090702.1 hypothetical protein [Oscillospiraceae bacterium]MCC8157581.1 hypothetical protein [Oscillospiraceae bacterium]MCD7742927.1 hypothetical protein [Oscillospiraceae bacterium]MCD7787074.1 hypothetical protein [Oscillospiraceae bacterium]
MYGRNPICRAVGIALLIIGGVILFARVLPAGFWWFCVGAASVLCGYFLLRR